VPEDATGPAEFARRLLATGEIAPVRGPLRRAKTSGTPPRIAAIRDAIVRSTIGWLARSGGWQGRAVVAGGRRREGRVWASGIWESLQVSFSPASLELVLRSAVAASRPWGITLDSLEQALAGLAPASTGDLLLFHVALEPLVAGARGPGPPERAETPTEDERPARGARLDRKAASAEKRPASAPGSSETRARRVRALLARSPLTALFRADETEPPAGETERDDAAARAACAERFAPLVAGDRAVLLTYLDESLAKRWILRETARRAFAAGEIAEARRSYGALAAAFEGLVDAALAAGRPDALRPLARFYERYVVAFGQREAVASYFRQGVQSLTLASERAAALARVARIFSASRLLESAADRILDIPFVDRTEPEKVFVADYQERVRGIRPELEAMRRELAGEVG
jgi:hypothetical protein